MVNISQLAYNLWVKVGPIGYFNKLGLGLPIGYLLRWMYHIFAMSSQHILYLLKRYGLIVGFGDESLRLNVWLLNLVYIIEIAPNMSIRNLTKHANKWRWLSFPFRLLQYRFFRIIKGFEHLKMTGLDWKAIPGLLAFTKGSMLLCIHGGQYECKLLSKLV